MRVSRFYIVSIIMLIFSACSQEKKTDWKVSFDKNSKEPYGCYIAYHILNDIFPGTVVKSGRNPFVEINAALTNSTYQSNQSRLSIIVSRNFKTDSLELDKMIRYVKQGNSICLISENFSDNIFNYFHAVPLNVPLYSNQYYSGYQDTVANQKINLFFNHIDHSYFFNGLPIGYSFAIDSTYEKDYYYMGYVNNNDSPNILINYENNGSFMICRSPIAMTNYFLLQQNNREYLEYFFSSFTQYCSSVTWYNLYERKPREDNENNFSNLLNFPPLFYAFLLMVLLLLFYTVFESRRRQRNIPILQNTTNSSLEFTETVGMLYYNKKDNKNLSEKMILHYLENVRTKYGLKTGELNDEFVTLLSKKIDHSFSDTNAFIAYVRYIRDCNQVTDIDIQHLYKQLQKFI